MSGYYTNHNNDGFIAVNASEIVSENNYYAFGMEHKGYNTAVQPIGSNKAQQYKYQGQERQDELGLNWDSFKWRNYDYAIGRFFGIDPIAEEFYDISTYQFAHNNPVWKVEIEGLEGVPFQSLMTADAAANPNGVGAHAIGIAEGLGNSVKGLWDAVTSPVQTAKGLGNTLLAGAANASGIPAAGYSNALAIDNALGTNASGTMEAIGQSMEQGVNDLVSGNGRARGNVIGEIAGAVIGSKGTGMAVKGLTKTAVKGAVKVSPKVQAALNTLDDIKANGGQVKMNPMKPNQELNMTIRQGSQKLDLRVESHKLPSKYGGDGVNPTRHMNVDLKGSNLPNKGHVNLEQ